MHRLLKVWNVSKYKRTNTGGTLPIESSSAAIDDMDPESAKEPTPPPPEDNTNLLSPVPSTCQPMYGKSLYYPHSLISSIDYHVLLQRPGTPTPRAVSSCQAEFTSR